MTLRDHQPDILFQGDALRRGLHRARGEAAFLSRNIALELVAMAAAGDPARRGAGRAWILGAQARRRKALADAAAYRRLIAERAQLATVVSSLERGGQRRWGI
ncbi:MAG: hypothetical protein OEU09_03345 [Rhodospirillales bacterium]|nr:hypothetical protein [Rhodospirillales bacterium]MDH3910305.1 hypothetical protein [Rhodospirillales bacterium]MDH3918116.1 hypothetical protein [Rhodospirillales bacterium]MDH3968981.1 hypothetical protein [Rhodospirillales bacterium]